MAEKTPFRQIVLRLSELSGRFRFSSMYWRDRVGIEPTGPGTQVPQGFEDPGRHQSLIQPRNL